MQVVEDVHSECWLPYAAMTSTKQRREHIAYAKRCT